ncbi:hypothetical protein Lokhon_01333 [Limimaricola hongkongensis DSM 17492]|uniref:Uncharacterized protein n=1 Tax=Limimaricola hongkongensis DSM 17492 TaxID=1122180 RepID=A0A017HDJ5_9RHOB|nr:hypothetical protein Lokhon_01333 [Limimaricola hongkongensis DSM 17492]
MWRCDPGGGPPGGMRVVHSSIPELSPGLLWPYTVNIPEYGAPEFYCYRHAR